MVCKCWCNNSILRFTNYFCHFTAASVDYNWDERDEENNSEYEDGSARAAEQSDETEQAIDTTKPAKRGTIHFITPRLVAALDNCKVSDGYSVHILTAVADALGHRIEDLVINRSSVQRCRTMYREEMSDKIKADFHKIVN